jgi:hypothetical protein
MQKFTELMLGGQDISTYAAYFIFALIGALLSLYVKSLKRDPSSPNTPAKFSWYFLFQDNLMRLVAGFLFSFISFRFSNEFLGTEATMWGAVIIGASTDRLAGIFEGLQEKARK